MSFRRMNLCCKRLQELGKATGILDMEYKQVGFGYILDGFDFCPYCRTPLKENQNKSHVINTQEK